MSALLAYHLPLDMHPELGNNRQLARVLDMCPTRAADADGLIWLGEAREPMYRRAEFAGLVAERLGRRRCMCRARARRTVQRIAWCTGGAQRYIGRAAALGADLYLSGEISEQTVHEAKELGWTTSPPVTMRRSATACRPSAPIWRSASAGASVHRYRQPGLRAARRPSSPEFFRVIALCRRPTSHFSLYWGSLWSGPALHACLLRKPQHMRGILDPVRIVRRQWAIRREELPDILNFLLAA
jgi:hypothetical protein